MGLVSIAFSNSRILASPLMVDDRRAEVIAGLPSRAGGGSHAPEGSSSSSVDSSASARLAASMAWNRKSVSRIGDEQVVHGPADSFSTIQLATGPGSALQESQLVDQDGLDGRQDDGDEDSGVIRCICGINDDDGFTIQCDRCLVWQHCACFGMSSSSVPEEYLCELCDPRPVNVAFAQEHQQRRKELDARKARAEKTFNDRRQSEARSPTTQTPPITSTTDDPYDENGDGIGATVSTTTASYLSKGQVPLRLLSQPRSRKPSQILDIGNTDFVLPDTPASAGVVGNNSKFVTMGRRKPGPKPGARRTPLTTPTSAHNTTPRGFSFPLSTPRDERVEDETLSNTDKMEAWHFEFTPISRNLVAEPRILEVLAGVIIQYEQGSPLRAERDSTGHLCVPLADIRGATVTSAALEDEESGAVSNGAGMSDSMLEDATLRVDSLGLSAVGHECVPVEIEASSLSNVACDVYVRNISETASSAIFTNVLYINTLPTEKARPWCASRTFSKPVMHGLFAGNAIPAGAFITEFRGELTTSASYLANPANQYSVLGASKPHVHLFPPPLSLAIDARRFGTEARFARYGCHPNAAIRPILLKYSASTDIANIEESEFASQTPIGLTSSRAGTPTFANYGNGAWESGTPEGPELRFGLFALSNIARSHEIILGWEWDDQHIVHFLPELIRNPALETPSRPRSVTVVEMADKGDFPYASTVFSNKMNAATTALLSSTLCSCIGSATPQSGSGGGSASSHNARKQDCAVAQMLRVGQGMGLMNVNIPGSAKNSHRKVRAPNFAPLVGVKRWWRQLSMPPTPPRSTLIEETHATIEEKVPQLVHHPSHLLLQGRVTRIMEADLHAVVAKASEAEAIFKTSLKADLVASEEAIENRQADQAYYALTQEIEAAEKFTETVDEDLDGDGAASDVSSLTEPLSGLSELGDTDDNSALLDPFGHSFKDVNPQEAGAMAPSVLPLKKRVAGTRLKANHIHHDDPEAEDKTNRQNARKAQRAAATNKARAAKAAKRQALLAARKASARLHSRNSRSTPGRASSNESEADEQIAPLKSFRKKDKRKIGRSTHHCKAAERSSPLSSAPEGHEHTDRDFDSLSDGSETGIKPQASLRRQRASSSLACDESDEYVSSGSEPVRQQPRGKALKSGSWETHHEGDAAHRQRDQKRKAQEQLAERCRKKLHNLPDTEFSDDVDMAPTPPSRKWKVSDSDRTTEKARRNKRKKRQLAARIVALQDSATENEELTREEAETGDHKGSMHLIPHSNMISAMSTADTVPMVFGKVASSIKMEEGLPAKAEETSFSEMPFEPRQNEPEKPRAKLSLADWKKQQAEKRKALQNASTSDTSNMQTLERTVGRANGGLPAIDTVITTSHISSMLPVASSAAPASSVTFVPTVATVGPITAVSMPPAPLPLRSHYATKILPPPPLPTTTFATSTVPSSTTSVVTNNLAPSPSAVAPLSNGRCHEEPAAPTPLAPTLSVQSAASLAHTTFPSAPPSPSASQVFGPIKSPRHGLTRPSDDAQATNGPASGSQRPVQESALPWTAHSSLSTNQAAAGEARGPGVGPSSGQPAPVTTRPGHLIASPPPHAPAAWGTRAIIGGSNSGGARSPTSFGNSVAAGAPQRPTSRSSFSASSSNASTPGSFCPAQAPLTPSTGRFDPPPSPRNVFNARPGYVSLGPPAAPMAPATLRNGNNVSSSTPAVPFNPPKAPKALLNQQHQQATAVASTGYNSTPIGSGAAGSGLAAGTGGTAALAVGYGARQHSAGVPSVGGSHPGRANDFPSLNAPSGPRVVEAEHPPLDPVDSASREDVRVSPPAATMQIHPQRHLSILGRGGGSAGTNGSPYSGDRTLERVFDRSTDGGTAPSGSEGGRGRSHGPGWGFHGGFLSGRGHHHHRGQGFTRGGWRGRGGGGGGVVGLSGGGWGARARGRGRGGG